MVNSGADRSDAGSGEGSRATREARLLGSGAQPQTPAAVYPQIEDHIMLSIIVAR